MKPTFRDSSDQVLHVGHPRLMPFNQVLGNRPACRWSVVVDGLRCHPHQSRVALVTAMCRYGSMPLSNDKGSHNVPTLRVQERLAKGHPLDWQNASFLLTLAQHGVHV